ncbi:hypothetical protein FPV67DRAFT_1505218 [Lyophyllum atratum]|nr:hypothetical protein FPV67DRAFT_1505218 [Lyophyllum atratum]
MDVGSTPSKPGGPETSTSVPALSSTTDTAMLDGNGHGTGIDSMDTEPTPAVAPRRWIPPAAAPSSNPGHTSTSMSQMTDVEPGRHVVPALAPHPTEPHKPLSPKRGLDVEDLWRDAIESTGPWSVGSHRRMPAPAPLAPSPPLHTSSFPNTLRAPARPITTVTLQAKTELLDHPLPPRAASSAEHRPNVSSQVRPISGDILPGSRPLAERIGPSTRSPPISTPYQRQSSQEDGEVSLGEDTPSPQPPPRRIRPGISWTRDASYIPSAADPPRGPRALTGQVPYRRLSAPVQQPSAASSYTAAMSPPPSAPSRAPPTGPRALRVGPIPPSYHAPNVQPQPAYYASSQDPVPITRRSRIMQEMHWKAEETRRRALEQKIRTSPSPSVDRDRMDVQKGRPRDARFGDGGEDSGWSGRGR